MSKPLVSVIIPTYNEEDNIGRCLKSIRRQNFPTSKYEILVVDDSSTDNTLKISKKYNAKVITHTNRHGEIGKMIGFKKAKGKYAIYLDADNEMKGRYWFQKMFKPLEENGDIVASFTYEGTQSSDSPLERYYSFDPLQRDTIYKLFSPSIKETVIKKNKDFDICEYSVNKIPPAGRCMYRREQILKYVKDYEMFMELDFLSLLVSMGHSKFAYVHSAGLYHHHASTLRQLLKKRKYNVSKVYLATYNTRLYTWFDVSNYYDLAKILLLIIYANTFVLSTIYGIYLSVKHSDWAGMYEPVVSFLVTDQILLSFISDKRILRILK